MLRLSVRRMPHRWSVPGRRIDEANQSVEELRAVLLDCHSSNGKSPSVAQTYDTEDHRYFCIWFT